jgi:hypothetical protein
MLPNGDQSARPTTTDLRFADLSRRMDSQDRVLERLESGDNNIAASQFRIEKLIIETTEQLRARSEANTLAIKNLDAKVDHKDQSSIARDKQQVEMLRAEETARQLVDKMADTKHDADVADINTKIDKITDKLGDVFVTNRVILFLTAAIVVAVIVGVVSGKLGIVVNP